MIELRRATLGWYRSVLAPNFIAGIIAIALIAVAVVCLVSHYLFWNAWAQQLFDYSGALATFVFATSGLSGLYGLLRAGTFHMIDQPPTLPPYQVEIRNTTWIRADRGGFLQLHVAPGDTVREGDPLATNTSLIGTVLSVLTAPADAVVLGMTTIPSIAPGDPICHLANAARRRLPSDAGSFCDFAQRRGVTEVEVS